MRHGRRGEDAGPGGRKRRISARTVALGEMQETFLIAAVAMILLIRLQLFVTDYPSLSGGKLHVAHLLWGGLLMLVAIGILLTFIGRRWRQPAAVIGGAGFGFFIDEVGKFITSDNDYFFKPTAAIIYITFIAIYFVARWMRERRGFSADEKVANAIDLYTDAALGELSDRRKQLALDLLDEAGDHPLAPSLRTLIEEAPAAPESRSRLARLGAAVRRGYERVASKRWFARVVIALFLLDVAIPVVAMLLLLVTGVAALFGADVHLSVHLKWSELGWVLAYAATSVLTGIGVVRLLQGRRLDAYQMFYNAQLVHIFVGQVFAFIDDSFVAIWGFLFDVLLLVSLRFMMRQERRMAHEAPSTA
jgi:hypothetical protein